MRDRWPLLDQLNAEPMNAVLEVPCVGIHPVKRAVNVDEDPEGVAELAEHLVQFLEVPGGISLAGPSLEREHRVVVGVHSHQVGHARNVHEEIGPLPGAMDSMALLVLRLKQRTVVEDSPLSEFTAQRGRKRGLVPPFARKQARVVEGSEALDGSRQNGVELL